MEQSPTHSGTPTSSEQTWNFGNLLNYFSSSYPTTSQQHDCSHHVLYVESPPDPCNQTDTTEEPLDGILPNPSYSSSSFAYSGDRPPLSRTGRTPSPTYPLFTVSAPEEYAQREMAVCSSFLGGPLSAPVVVVDNKAGFNKTIVGANTTIMGDSNKAKTSEVDRRVGIPESTKRGEESLWTVALVLLTYCSISLAVVYFNYWLFTSSFRHPVVVSCVQQFVGLFIYIVFSFTLHQLYSQRETAITPLSPKQQLCLSSSPQTTGSTPTTPTPSTSIVPSPVQLPSPPQEDDYATALPSTSIDMPHEDNALNNYHVVQQGAPEASTLSSRTSRQPPHNRRHSAGLYKAVSYQEEDGTPSKQLGCEQQTHLPTQPFTARQHEITIFPVSSADDFSTNAAPKEVPAMVNTLIEFFPKESFEASSCWSVLPLALCFVGMVAFSNLCLKYTQVSTYQVARSMTLLFTVGFSYAVLGQRQSFQSMTGCFLIVVGFLVGSLDPSTLSLLGVGMGVCSSAFQACYNVAIKTTLDRVGNRQGVLLFYNLLISSFLFIPVIWLAGEGWVVTEELPWNPMDPKFWDVWPSLWLSGLLSTMMNLSAFTCVKVTSPVTFNIAGKTKACVQSLGGIVLFGDYVTSNSLVGIGSCLLGSFVYSHSKFKIPKKCSIRSSLSVVDGEVKNEAEQEQDGGQHRKVPDADEKTEELLRRV
eukprot:GHVS01010907.1.p1 GENE.GHVS01010907.1~~GHVS01010907.1.p1  ORF type:complete len:700 (+),score=99.53 GHVS01010907.1:136-2235(+)